MKKIIIVGAGPGGLSAGMILAHRGFDVTIYEKDSKVGGRNKCLEEKGYKFDVGPTFLMLKFVLDEMFEEAGAKASDYLKFQKLDPMYRLSFKDFEMDLTQDHKKMRKLIAEKFPGDEEGFDRLLNEEKRRFDKMYPCLQKDYSTFGQFFDKTFISAIPILEPTKSMYRKLGEYFKSGDLKLCFTFQSKYLGMSPWECPAAFMIIPFMEHEFGIYHTEGGLSEISVAMQKVFTKNKGKLLLKKPVKRLLIDGHTLKGVELEDGTKDYADEIIVNADFAYAMETLAEGKARKYTPKKLAKMNYSCSTYMLYLGLDKLYDLPHHTIVFSEDYEKYVKDIFKTKELNMDLSVYIRNASINDPTLAPKGHSALYILVPVANNQSGIDWEKQKRKVRDAVFKLIRERTNMKDFEKHITFERDLTPDVWEKKFNVYKAATFNLGHTPMQMLYWRPRNKFEGLDNCYLVGGGTHPGSGLPTIYESGRITSNLISKKYNITFTTKNLLVR